MRHLLGAGMLAGIGFTVSLFITNLAIHNADLNEMAKIGILSGSILSGIMGCTVLLLWPGTKRR